MKAHAEILLVEDNRAEARLAREAFAEAGLDDHLSMACDGLEALDFLRQRPPFAHAPRPDLVLLDFNLPHKDGREVLREMKSDADLRRIPVIVLTTSHAREDIVLAYDLHANCYVAKPMDIDDFIAVLTAIRRFWIDIAVLPAA